MMLETISITILTYQSRIEIHIERKPSMRLSKWLAATALFVAPLLLDSQSSHPLSLSQMRAETKALESKRLYLKSDSALCPERILERAATDNDAAFRSDLAAVFSAPGDVRNAAMRKLGCGVWKGREEITIDVLHYQKTDYVMFTFASPSDYHYNNVMMVTKLENIENNQDSQPLDGSHAQGVDYHDPVYLKANSIACSYNIYMNLMHSSDAVTKDFKTVFSDAPPAERKDAEVRLNCSVSSGRILVNLLAQQGNGGPATWQRFSVAKVVSGIVVDDAPGVETYLSRKEDFEN
jgi:hypothetical protein